MKGRPASRFHPPLWVLIIMGWAFWGVIIKMLLWKAGSYVSYVTAGIVSINRSKGTRMHGVLTVVPGNDERFCRSRFRVASGPPSFDMVDRSSDPSRRKVPPKARSGVVYTDAPRYYQNTYTFRLRNGSNSLLRTSTYMKNFARLRRGRDDDDEGNQRSGTIQGDSSATSSAPRPG